ncbi:MAG: hypothetical protein ACUVXJ_13830 [Phycisphaerae bacterium]
MAAPEELDQQPLSPISRRAFFRKLGSHLIKLGAIGTAVGSLGQGCSLSIEPDDDHAGGGWPYDPYLDFGYSDYSDHGHYSDWVGDDTCGYCDGAGQDYSHCDGSYCDYTNYGDYADYADYYDYSDYYDYANYSDYSNYGNHPDYSNYGNYSDYANYYDYGDYYDYMDWGYCDGWYCDY